MKLVVRKPVDGLVTVTLDDRRGATGMRETLKDVPVEGLEGLVRGLVGRYHSKRKAVYAARKQDSA